MKTPASIPASTLPRQHTGIGQYKLMCCQWSADPFWNALIRGARRVDPYGNTFRLYPVSQDVLDLIAPSKSLAWADGWIAGIVNDDILRALVKFGKPVINVSSQYTGTEFPSVVPDERATGRKAAEFLIQRGFKQFGYYGYPAVRYAALRGAGFRETVEAAGLPYRELLAVRDRSLSPEENTAISQQRLCDWLRSFPERAGIFTVEGRLTQEIHRACRSLKLRVPDDLGVMSVEFHSDPMPTLPVPTTCVLQDIERVGQTAVEWLMRLIQGHPAPIGTLFVPPMNVEERESTRPSSELDPLFLRATRYIQEHYRNEKLLVEEVAQIVGLSRRSLERLFKATGPTSVHGMILRSRLDQSKQLLAQTHLRMKQVAEQSGFRDEFQFSKIFRREFGMSPRQYRETKSHTGQETDAPRQQ